LDFGIPKEADNLFKAATECILGDGNNLRFWSDHWLGNFSIADIAPNLMRFLMSARKNDSVAFALENHAWTEPLRHSVVSHLCPLSSSSWTCGHV
jgi:hypothetical protein